MCPHYIAGLVGLGERKSMQPMAARQDGLSYDRLQHFISVGRWNDAPLARALLVEADHNRTKDVMQTGSIMEALVLTCRQADLASVFFEARGDGPQWRKALEMGLSYLSSYQVDRLPAALLEGLKTIGKECDPADLFEIGDNSAR